MAIFSLFYSILIPIENLRRILTKEQLREILTERTCDGKIWFDDYLYREGSMSPADNERIIKFWESKGASSNRGKKRPAVLERFVFSSISRSRANRTL